MTVGASLADTTPEEAVKTLLPKLRSERVTYFPVRHHSPACAHYVRQLILELRPKTILIEGPASFNSKIPFLAHADCVSPVAIFTNFVDKKERLNKSAQLTEPRFSAYYPFCDYSPELVAVRTGIQVGAEPRFIDLEYAEMVLNKQREAEAAKETAKESLLIESLTQDEHLRHSRYVRELAQQLELRDFDEVWDHLFESCWPTLSTTAFMERVVAYCTMARLSYSETDLVRDGSVSREQCMASHIAEALEEKGNTVLVVTGGFHTVVLPDLVAQKVKRPESPEFATDETGAWLMRYSFNKLDSRAGYQSGMPSPAFYDHQWQQATLLVGEESEVASLSLEDLTDRFNKIAAQVTLDVASESRRLSLANTISTPDAIAAAAMTKQLALMRGHPWPLREDILDGIRACFIKGEIHVDGVQLWNIVTRVLAGDRVGKIPSGCDQPPIVADFYQQVKEFRIPVETVQKKELALELYRNATHRQISRFLHRLSLLSAPFGRFIDGPDFVTGERLDLIQEKWETAWTPMVESSLIEASIYGVTIEEAAANKLKSAIADLQDEGANRSTAAIVKLLVRACRMGLHAQTQSLLDLISSLVAEDPALSSVVQGLSQLELLHKAREPLEASNLAVIPQLMLSAYHRACRLLTDAARCPESEINATIQSLQILREVISNVDAAELDRTLFVRALKDIAATLPQDARSPVVGAAIGVLYGEGAMNSSELIEIVCGYLGGASSDPRRSAGLLRGLLATACEIAWQVSEIIEALDEQFSNLDEKMFLELLPELRLAFTSLTPRDIAKVAEMISGLNQGENLNDLLYVDLDENEVQYALRLNERVRDALLADGFLK